MRDEKWVRERILGLQQRVDGATDEWTKEHLRMRIDEMELVLEERGQK